MAIEGTNLTVRDLVTELVKLDMDAEAHISVYNSDPLPVVSAEEMSDGIVVISNVVDVRVGEDEDDISN